MVHYSQLLNKLWETVQIDLIDVRADPDGEYQWILHIRDHFSKYSYTYPLKSKESSAVAIPLMVWIGQPGPRKILQCDNGNDIVLRLVKFYRIIVVHGRPRHPQSQGFIEQANAVLKRKIQS